MEGVRLALKNSSKDLEIRAMELKEFGKHNNGSLSDEDLSAIIELHDAQSLPGGMNTYLEQVYLDLPKERIKKIRANLAQEQLKKARQMLSPIAGKNLGKTPQDRMIEKLQEAKKEFSKKKEEDGGGPGEDSGI